MHQSSYDRMTRFCREYLAHRRGDHLIILDIGSMNVNGCYRPLFNDPAWRYQGVDMEAGKNVDIVLNSPYDWTQISSKSIDVVISGQAFEHIQYFWITLLEIARVLKPGGLGCIIAPSSGPEHRYPTDCWRFYPDGLSAMAAFAGVAVREATTYWKDENYTDGSDAWHDSVLIFQKPVQGFPARIKTDIKRFIQHKALTIGVK